MPWDSLEMWRECPFTCSEKELPGAHGVPLEGKGERSEVRGEEPGRSSSLGGEIDGKKLKS